MESIKPIVKEIIELDKQIKDSEATVEAAIKEQTEKIEGHKLAIERSFRQRSTKLQSPS